MPRSRRAFDRTKARTFEVVFRPIHEEGDSERALRPVQRGNASSAGDVPGEDISEQELSYERKEFELGEFGFPDDGYDYSKHFKPMGSVGAVFIAAPNTSGVEKKSVHDAFKLRDEATEDVEDVEQMQVSERNIEDEKLRANAVQEIERERLRNAELDAVFAALDSDAETQDGAGSAADEQLFPDDFVERATGESRKHEHALDSKQALPQPEVRGKRVLDDQFEELLKMYENDDESEEEEDAEWNADDISSTTNGDEIDGEQCLSDAQLAALLGADDCMVEEVAQTEVEEEVFDKHMHAQTELTSAMNTLMDSYKRVSAEDAFAAIVGPGHTRKALAAAEAAERQADSGSEDAELDAEIESLYAEQKQWDCETIISTYSNLDNHPSVIDDSNGVRRRPRRQAPPVIRLDPRTQLPVGAAPERAPVQRDDFGSQRRAPATKAREKTETKEEKRKRKASVKQAARERRAVKSEMKSAFAKESRTQERHATALGKSKVVVHF